MVSFLFKQPVDFSVRKYQARYVNSTEQTHICRLVGTKVTGISRLLDSNQGLRVPIRDSHCAWVYREYEQQGREKERASSPWRRNAPTKSIGDDLLPGENVTCHVRLCVIPLFPGCRYRDPPRVAACFVQSTPDTLFAPIF